MNKIILLIITAIIFLLLPLPACSFDRETGSDLLKTIEESPQIQEEILTLVADNLFSLLKYGNPIMPPGEISDLLLKRAGVFVSLEKYGQPRGCRGTLYPAFPTMAEELISASTGAATRDYRVPPVTFEELRKLKITVTVVGEVTPVGSYESEVDPLIHGIMVQTPDGEKKGVMLPGEAPTQEKQFLWAKKRAGISPEESVQIFMFAGVKFSGNLWEILDEF